MDKNRWLRIGLAILVVFLVCVFLRLASSILIPFAMALLIAFAVSPVLDFLVSRRVPKTIAVILILILSFAVLYLFGTVFYAGGKSLAEEFPSYTEMVKGILARIDSSISNPRLKVGLAESIQNFNIGQAGNFLLSALGPFLSFMSDLFLVFIFMIFILAARGRMLDKVHKAFAPTHAATMSRTAARIDREIQKYLGVKTLTNLAIGILVAAILAVLGVRFAVLFGVLAFLLNYVPTLGAIVAVALPAIITLVIEGGVTLKVILVLVLLAAVHAALDRLIERRLMTMEISLSPLLVLFSLFFGAWLWGIPGMILAVPLLTAARIVFENVPSLDGLGKLMDR